MENIKYLTPLREDENNSTWEVGLGTFRSLNNIDPAVNAESACCEKQTNVKIAYFCDICELYHVATREADIKLDSEGGPKNRYYDFHCPSNRGVPKAKAKATVKVTQMPIEIIDVLGLPR